MPAGRGRGKPRGTPLRTGWGPSRTGPQRDECPDPTGLPVERARQVRCDASGPRSGEAAGHAVADRPRPGRAQGGGPAGRVPGPDRNRQQKSSAARCGAEAAVEGRGPPLPSPCRAKPAPAGGALGSARHCTGSAGAGPPSAAGRTRPPAGSRQPWQTVGARGRTRSPSAPSRQVPTPAAGGGPTGRGAAPAAEGGGPTRAPEREAGGPHRTWRPAARRDRGERRSRAAGPSPARERERAAGGPEGAGAPAASGARTPAPRPRRPRRGRAVRRAAAQAGRAAGPGPPGGYLVDPASSHMLVSKIKPCMSK